MIHVREHRRKSFAEPVAARRAALKEQTLTTSLIIILTHNLPFHIPNSISPEAQ
jgi:hypothetical protein